MKDENKVKEINEADKEHEIYHKRLAYVCTVILILLFGGATFYHKVEGWRYLDATYFSAYTLTTVGYGDFTPKTDAGKIFTIFYVFAGAGMVVYSLSLMASHFVEVRERFWFHRAIKKKMQTHKNMWKNMKNYLIFENPDKDDKDKENNKK